jgi:hypothetical protein
MLSRFLSCLVAVALVATAQLCRAAATDPHFVQDRFAVGLWVDPPADQQTDARFAEIAYANFTFLIGNLGATTPAAVSNQIHLCEQYGLKTIISMAGLPPDRLPNDTACWGYFGRRARTRLLSRLAQER